MKPMIAAYLVYAITQGTASGIPILHVSKMPDMETCLKASQAAQIKVPTGGDAETTVAVFCSSSAPTRVVN